MNNEFKSSFEKTAGIGNWLGEVVGYGRYGRGKKALQLAEDVFNKGSRRVRKDIDLLEGSVEQTKGELNRRIQTLNNNKPFNTGIPKKLKRNISNPEMLKSLEQDTMGWSNKKLNGDLKDLNRVIRDHKSKLKSKRNIFDKAKSDAEDIMASGKNRMFLSGLGLTTIGLGAGAYKLKKKKNAVNKEQQYGIA